MLNASKILDFSLSKIKMGEFDFFKALKLSENKDYIRLCELLPLIFKSKKCLYVKDGVMELKHYTHIRHAYNGDGFDSLSFELSQTIGRQDVNIMSFKLSKQSFSTGNSMDFSHCFMVSGNYKLIHSGTSKTDKALDEAEEKLLKLENLIKAELYNFWDKKSPHSPEYTNLRTDYENKLELMKSTILPLVKEKDFFDSIDKELRERIRLYDIEFEPKVFISTETKFDKNLPETEHIRHQLVVSYFFYPSASYISSDKTLYLGHLNIDCHDLSHSWECNLLSNQLLVKNKSSFKKWMNNDLFKAISTQVSKAFQ